MVSVVERAPWRWELGRIKLEKIPGLFLFHPASWVLSHFGKINGGNINKRYSGWKIQNILQISQTKTPQQVRATMPVQHGTHLPQTQRGTTTNCRLATGLPTGFLYSCHTEMLNLSQGAVPKKPSVIIQILCLPSKPHRVNRGGGRHGEEARWSQALAGLPNQGPWQGRPCWGTIWIPRLLLNNPKLFHLPLFLHPPLCHLVCTSSP